MAKLLSILLVALMFEAVGVVFLSKGLKEIGGLDQVNLAHILRLVGQVASNRYVLLGVFFEALFFVGLLMLMSKADVSFVWPLTSLSFVVTTVAAKLFLHEQIPVARWAGVCLIMIGAGLITWTEKNRPTSIDPIAAAHPANPRPQ